MKKRVVAVVLIVVMFFSICPIISSAAYDYLFPVNNGGKIAYVYGYSSSYGSRFHSGIDIHSSGDDTIYAAYDGVVGATANSCWHVSCGYQCEHYNTYGNYIRVNQDDGTKAYYGHLLKDSLMVSVGQRVTKGQPIAKMGSSGHSTGKHLHFEVRSGNNKINVNPTSSGGSINYSYSGYGSSGTSPNPTPYPSITYKSIPEGEYKLQNANGKFLGVDSGGNKNGNVHVVNGDSSAEQNFRIKNTEISNQYYIKSLANATQYCVNAYTPDDTLTSQSDVKLWDENKSNSKYWGFEDAGGGYYYIRCMMNPQFVLTADGYNYPENVTVLPFDGRDTQKWKLVEVVKNTEYTITYNANGGSGGPSSQQKNKGQSLTISSEFPERFGYSFVGWSTSSTSDKAQYIPGSTFSKDADTTLYAVWSAATELSETLGRRTGKDLEFPYAGTCRYYKITPKHDGLYRFESTGSLDTQIYIMSPKGAVYANDDNSGTDNNFLLDYALNAGTTYYIKIISKDAGSIGYSFTKLYTVTYNANGGSDAPETQYKLFKTNLKLSSEVPTREGYTFLGWSVSSDDNEVDAKPGATYKGDRDLILYAVWERNVHEHAWEWIIDKEATCTETGKRHQECKCGATQNEELYGILHDFGEWVVVDRETEYPFTITHQRTCSVCGETEQYLITATPGNPDEILYGDVNSDGTIDGLDATALLQFLAEWEVDIDFYAADVNADGVIDGLDATLLLQYLAEWDVILGSNK